MFNKALVPALIATAAFAVGAVVGINAYQYELASSMSTKIQRFERTDDVAYAFVPLKAILNNDTNTAINTLNNVLISGVKQLSDLYDPSDATTAHQILELIATIMNWRKNDSVDYPNSSELDEALRVFNSKHNKTSNLTGAKDAPSS